MLNNILLTDIDTKENFFTVIKALCETSSAELIRNAGAGTGNIEYKEIYGTVDELQYYFKYITRERLYSFPDPRFAILRNTIRPFFQILHDIRFQIKNENLSEKEQKSVIVNTYKVYVDATANPIELIWSLIREMVLIDTDKKLNIPKEGTEVLLQEELTKAANINLQLQAVLNAAQTNLSKKGIEKHAKLFHDQAREHEEKANNWRLSAIFLGILIIFVLYHMLSYVIGKQHGIDRIQATVVSIAIISLLSYGIAISIKNFFAEKHNQSINEHRGNCLGSVELFAQSADGDVKKAILLQATNTIFSYQKTGFLRKDSEQLNPNPMFEIFKKITEGNSES